MSTPLKILIATSKHDILNYGKTAEHLRDEGCEVVIFEPDSIADGSKTFQLHIEGSDTVVIEYDGQPFVPTSFHAAWHRRPNYFGEHKDALRWLSLKDEYGSLMKTIAEFIPEERWLNTAHKMRQAGQKIPQLIQAAAHGFTIPETMVSNQWKAVEQMTAKELIVKYAELTVLYPKGYRKTLPTTIVPRDNLPKAIRPYPGIWQPFHPKKKEWRVTVVGDAVFSAAIYSTEAAKGDWREHQDTPAITFKAEKFPEHLEELCRSFLRRLGLRYGAFDFIERPDGRFIFLEINPNGQFMWLEDKLGLPISQAIADELLVVARNSTS